MKTSHLKTQRLRQTVATSLKARMYSGVYLVVFLISTLALSLALTSCSPPQPHPAVTAYHQLISGLSYGDQERVWSLLALKSREVIIQELNAQANVQASDQANTQANTQANVRVSTGSESTNDVSDFSVDFSRVPSSFKISLDWALESPFATQVKLSSAEPPMINVFYASQSWQIPVIYEQNEWRIHLLDARLTPSPSPHR